MQGYQIDLWGGVAQYPLLISFDCYHFRKQNQLNHSTGLFWQIPVSHQSLMLHRSKRLYFYDSFSVLQSLQILYRLQSLVYIFFYGL